ncbi:unnamed protein product [marine sediment metagenome]|uniref:Uncharacterized protein n=1 Tax=marine sediment metagenome TaxID=412755 RepID=X1JWH8_9ZZZZ
MKLYTQNLSLAFFESEIEAVTNKKVFGILWSIGLNAEKQEIALKRWKELEK